MTGALIGVGRRCYLSSPSWKLYLPAAFLDSVLPKKIDFPKLLVGSQGYYVSVC